MSDFQRREIEGRPLDEEVDNEGHKPPPTSLEMEKLPQDLYGATLAEGTEEVEAALAQVETHRARPQELLAWIDDVRDRESDGDSEHQETDELAKSTLAEEFQPDSTFAAGDVDNPPSAGPEDDRPQAAATAALFGLDDDLDFMFPGRRKRHGDDEDKDGESTEESDTADKAKSKKP